VNNGIRLLKRAASGAAGGFVGALALQTLMSASRRWMPDALPPIREDPGRFMVRQMEHALPETARGWISESAENFAAAGLGVDYGMAFGALYGLIRPRGGKLLTDGAVLGAVCWAAGYLGWLPALGLMPPVWRQRGPQVIAPAAGHLVYGVAAVAVCNGLRRAFEDEDREPVESDRIASSLTSAAL
jgi:hypothetical protein